LDAALLLLLLPLLLLLLPPLPRRLLIPPSCHLLTLLAVHDQEYQCSGQAKDHETFHYAVIKIQRITAGHSIIIEVVIDAVVVLGIIL
jgi:hypothetical protein